MDDATNDARRKAISDAAWRRNYCCGSCGASGLQIVDGSQIGGMPGINYKHCGGCGWSRAITKRRRRPTKKELDAIFGKRKDT